MTWSGEERQLGQPVRFSLLGNVSLSCTGNPSHLAINRRQRLSVHGWLGCEEQRMAGGGRTERSRMTLQPKER